MTKEEIMQNNQWLVEGKGRSQRNANQRVAEVVKHLYNDICNGATHSNCVDKLMNDGYEVGFKYSKCRAEKLMRRAKDMIKADFEKDKEEMKARLYIAIQDVYNECREWKDRNNALKALDQISKLLGLNEPDKVDMKLQNVTIDFGLDDEK